MSALDALRWLPDAAGRESNVCVLFRQESAGNACAADVADDVNDATEDPLEGIVPLVATPAVTEGRWAAGTTQIATAAQVVPCFACLSSLPRLSLNRCMRWACLVAGSDAWLWLRLPGADVQAEHLQARTLVQKLRVALGAGGGELVGFIDLTRQFSLWCYRPLSLDALAEICSEVSMSAGSSVPTTVAPFRLAAASAPLRW